MICIRIKVQVKNDHCSKFSSLSNWKTRSLKKKQGFNGIGTRDLREYRCFESRWSPDFFSGFLFCDDHSSLISTTAVQIWVISCILHSIFRSIEIPLDKAYKKNLEIDTRLSADVWGGSPCNPLPALPWRGGTWPDPRNRRKSSQLCSDKQCL